MVTTREEREKDLWANATQDCISLIRIYQNAIAQLDQVVSKLTCLVYIEVREVMSPERFVAGVTLQNYLGSVSNGRGND
jgi:hypothetical protein